LLDFFVVDFAAVDAVIAVSCMTGAVELVDIVVVSVVDVIAAVVSAELLSFLEQPVVTAPASTSTAIAAPCLKVPLTLPPYTELTRRKTIPMNSIRRRLGFAGIGGNKGADSDVVSRAPDQCAAVASRTARA
jgi:hypothetical protein